MSREISIAKLSSFGKSDKLLARFVNFLCNRTQFVSYDGAVFTPVSVACSVVQRSVVSSQVFTMVINNLPKCVVTMRMVL